MIKIAFPSHNKQWLKLALLTLTIFLIALDLNAQTVVMLTEMSICATFPARITADQT
jgi:hypothetical protein